MAITLKKAKQELTKKRNAPLTADELSTIGMVESEIDKKITDDFDGTSPILISIKEKTVFGNNSKHRVEIMVRELEKRYKKAGWKTDILYEIGAINDDDELIDLSLSVKDENK
jgi:hypothetical protein